MAYIVAPSLHLYAVNDWELARYQAAGWQAATTYGTAGSTSQESQWFTAARAAGFTGGPPELPTLLPSWAAAQEPSEATVAAPAPPAYETNSGAYQGTRSGR